MRSPPQTLVAVDSAAAADTADARAAVHGTAVTHAGAAGVSAAEKEAVVAFEIAVVAADDVIPAVVDRVPLRFRV